MTREEAKTVKAGARVEYNGQPYEVLVVYSKGLAAPYFGMTPVGHDRDAHGLTSYRFVQLPATATKGAP